MTKARPVLPVLACVASMIMAIALAPVQAADTAKLKDDDRWVGPVDERLSKGVTVEADRQRINEVLEGLSKQTGVTFNAGYNKSDWQVRDRRVIIFAKNVSAAELMNSIARVMKFKWKREMSGDTASYRLLVDKKALSDAQKRMQLEEEYAAERRKAALDQIAEAGDASPEEIAQMRKDSPLLGFYAATGMAKGYGAMLRAIPGLGDALATGQALSLNASDLSPEGQSALKQYIDAFTNAASAIAKKPFSIGGVGNSTILVNDTFDGYDGVSLGTLGFRIPNGPSMNTDLSDPDTASSRAIGQQLLQAIDGDQARDDLLTGEGEKDAIGKAADEDRAKADPGDPAPERPDEPALHAKVTIKPKSRLLPDVLSALSESASFCVVSDSFGKQQSSSDMNRTDVELKDVLESVGKAYSLNWDKKTGTIEFLNRYWYRNLAALLPDASLELWRQAVRATGTLGLEELSQIADLKLEQMVMNIGGDDLLANSALTSTIMFNQDILRLYAALNERQRKTLFSKSGLGLPAITPSQWPMVQDLIQRKNGALLDDPNARVTFIGTSSQEGKQIKYTITLSSTSAHTHPTVWSILTPKYETAKDQKPK